MSRLSIIMEVEKQLPDYLLNGTYIHNGTSITFKEFLESIFINFVKPEANVANLVDYINSNLISKIEINKENINENIEIVLSNGKKIVVKKADLKKVEYIENFIANRVDYTESIRVSEDQYINVLDTLISKIPFMDDDYMITIGPNKKSLNDFYLTLLDNIYKPATLVDKAEICIFYGSKLDEKVLKSTMDGMNLTVEEYISRILPNQMINATDIVIDGNKISICEAIERISKHQINIIEAEEKRKLEEKENLYNRTSENPGLLSEINLALSENHSLEITAEIPVVTKGKLNDEELAAITSLPADIIYTNDEETYKRFLNDIKSAIKATNNMHDLEDKVAEFKRVAEEALSKNLSTYIQNQILSIDELINEKRNEIIKIESNKEDYIEAIQDRIEELKNQLRKLSTIDDYSIIYGDIVKLEREVYDKCIKDYQLIASLESLIEEYKGARAKYDFKTTDFESQKSAAIGHINDLFSDLRIKSNNLTHMENARDIQNIAIAINVKREQITNALNDYLKNKSITEIEYKNYKEELEMLIQKCNNVDNIGYGYR